MAEAKGIDVHEKNAQETSRSDTGMSKGVLTSIFLPQLLTFPAAHTNSQSDVLRAAGIGIAEDDPTEPILTLRMWVLGIGFCVIASGLNTLYTLGTPSLTISSSVVLLLGKLSEKLVPSGCSFNLNPGLFKTNVGH